MGYGAPLQYGSVGAQPPDFYYASAAINEWALAARGITFCGSPPVRQLSVNTISRDSISLSVVDGIR